MNSTDVLGTYSYSTHLPNMNFHRVLAIAMILFAVCSWLDYSIFDYSVRRMIKDEYRKRKEKKSIKSKEGERILLIALSL